MSVSNMMAEKRLRKYKKKLSDAGWDLKSGKNVILNTEKEIDGPVFYLCDYESGQLHIVSTVSNTFDIVIDHKNEHGHSFQDVCDAFGSLYTDICDLKIKLADESANILALAVSSYISGTQGYQAMLSQGEEMHFLVIRHWDHSANLTMLRPVPIEAKEYYDPEHIEYLVEEVLGIDRQNHPERFKSAEIVPFKINNRTDM